MKVFVYGTLRKYQKYHYLLEHATPIAEQAWTYGKLYDTGRGYPAMVIDDSNRVYGEIYEITADQLRELDQLEGYRGEDKRNEYERVIRTVYTDSDRHQAFVYVYDSLTESQMKLIPLGDWKCEQLIKQDTLLYFAYGSCMDDNRFCKAKVEHLFQDLVGCGIVQGYSLKFTYSRGGYGFADIVEGDGRVEGKIYRINQQALAYLFQREGVYEKAYRPGFINVMLNGRIEKDVLTFFVVDKKEEKAPPIWYAEEIIRGASGYLSEEYVQKLIKDFEQKFGLTSL
jgi:gamma-glutamylcyclotransferase (GGCT)/AIG2-like uncharacterized protein YtfP